MTLRTWWRRRSGPVPPPAERDRREAALEAAADWCVTRAYHGGYSGVPYEVTVADVQRCADQDFGLPRAPARQAAAAIRERLYARGRRTGLRTDAFDRRYCAHGPDRPAATGGTSGAGGASGG
ncbi:hypothetical protein ACFYM0_37025 [Streptomyces sp. NPDC006487]|uniref:hypothetical protein n=1 Tax=Streptomyces sp. NPDC006487 TaxID=3364748 RepID=UPI003679A91A